MASASAYALVRDFDRVRVGIRFKKIRVSNSHSGPHRKQVKKSRDCRVLSNLSSSPSPTISITEN